MILLPMICMFDWGLVYLLLDDRSYLILIEMPLNCTENQSRSFLMELYPLYVHLFIPLHGRPSWTNHSDLYSSIHCPITLYPRISELRDSENHKLSSEMRLSWKPTERVHYFSVLRTVPSMMSMWSPPSRNPSSDPCEPQWLNPTQYQTSVPLKNSLRVSQPPFRAHLKWLMLLPEKSWVTQRSLLLNQFHRSDAYTDSPQWSRSSWWPATYWGYSYPRPPPTATSVTILEVTTASWRDYKLSWTIPRCWEPSSIAQWPASWWQQTSMPFSPYHHQYVATR